MPAIFSPGPTADVEYYTPQVQAVRVRQADDVLQHAPLHRLVAGAPLKLDVQHQCMAIGQGDVEYLVRGQRLGRQFDIERVGVAHVSLEQPGCKVGDEGTDQLVQWTIGVGHSACSSHTYATSVAHAGGSAAKMWQASNSSHGRLRRA